MKKTRKRLCAILLALLIGCFLMPLTAAADGAYSSGTYTFQTVACDPTGIVHFTPGEYTFDYPEGAEMATMTVNGSSVVFKIPAIGNIDHDLTIYGKFDKNYYTARTPGWKDPERNLQYIGSISGSFTIGKFRTNDSYTVLKKDETYASSVSDFDNDKICRWFECNVGQLASTSYVIIHLAGHSSETYPDGTEVGDTASVAISLKNLVSNASQTHTGYASTDPGEDEGVDFAAIGGGVAVAIGVGAALAGGKKKNNKNSKKNVGYKMYVYKDFGDAIRKGAPGVKVCARVTQTVDGRETDSFELTQSIKCSGENLKVTPAGPSGKYFTALVSAGADSAEGEGAVTFTAATPGGVFTRNVIFRIVGEPSIVFPRDTEDGRLDMSVSDDTVELIAGLGGREKLRFMFRDATEEPVGIRFGESNGLRITSEKDTRYQFTYYAAIDNNTSPVEKENGIFAEEEKRRITIYAKFPDGREVTGYFTVNLYPDGLYVYVPKDKKKDGNLLVDTLPQEMGGDWNGAITIPYTSFDLFVTYTDADGRAVIKKNPAMGHKDKLTDDGRYGRTFTDNFTFKIHHAGSAGIEFNPGETLPELGEPYYAKMMLSSSVDGRTFEGELPMALSGEKPKLPSVIEWEKAYELLKRDIRYFGVDGEPHLRELIREARAKTLSASDLEHIRHYLLLCAVSYYEKDSREYEKIDAVMTRYIVVSSALVKAGDLAVEFLITQVWPKELGGTVAAKFINPLKNMLCNYIGQYISVYGGEPERGEIESMSFARTLIESVQAALEESITGDMKPNPEQLGYIVAAYLMVCFLKHYYGDDPHEKGDIYRSMIAAGRDLTFAKIKAWFSGVIKNASETVINKVGQFCGTFYKGMFSNSVQNIVKTAGDKAFQQSIRASMESGGLSAAQYAIARGLKTAAMDKEGVIQKWIVDTGAKNVSEVVNATASLAAGSALNFLTGTNKEGEVYGVTVEDVITEYIAERWKTVGVKVYNMLDNPLDASVRIEDGCLKFGVFDYRIEFPVRENIPVMVDAIFTVCFDWMKSLWNAAVNPPVSAEDLRDRIERNTDVLDEQLERLNNMKPVEFTKDGNYTMWGGGSE